MVLNSSLIFLFCLIVAVKSSSAPSDTSYSLVAEGQRIQKPVVSPKSREDEPVTRPLAPAVSAPVQEENKAPVKTPSTKPIAASTKTPTIKSSAKPVIASSLKPSQGPNDLAFKTIQPTKPTS